jgi:hypothetical protein
MHAAELCLIVALGHYAIQDIIAAGSVATHRSSNRRLPNGNRKTQGKRKEKGKAAEIKLRIPF